MKEKQKKIIWISVTILLILFIFFLPFEIEYSKYFSSNQIGFPLIFIALPCLIYKTITTITKEVDFRIPLGLSILSVIIVGPTNAYIQTNRENKELKINGNLTKCIVTSRTKYSKTKYWQLKCKYYTGNSEYYTYNHSDEENKYRIGDTIKLIYNIKHPKMYKIMF